MKENTIAIFLIALSTAICVFALDTDNLDVGNNPSNAVSGYSTAVGDYNDAQTKSIAVGHNNDAIDNSGAVGHWNTAGHLSTASGWGNKVWDTSLSVGVANEVNLEYATTGGQSSFLVGDFSKVEGSSCFSAGGSNTVGDVNSLTRSAAAIGSYLTNTNDLSVVVGYANANKPGLRFSVGCGDASYAIYKNGLEVYDDGVVVINEPQGDIAMGSYE